MKNDQVRLNTDWKTYMSHRMAKGFKMKTIYARVMTSGVSLIMTSLLTFSLPAHASDIDIYQAAKAGSVTLMFMLDTSGSMGYGQVAESACDLPSGATSTHSTDTSTNGTPTYPRDYCEVTIGNTYFYKKQTTTTSTTNYVYKKQTTTTGNTTNYYYKKETTSVTTTAWQSCGASGSTSRNSCTTNQPTAPSTAGYTTSTNSGYTYYSKIVSGSTRYYYRSKDTITNPVTYYDCGGSTLTSACTTVIGTPSVSGYLTTGSNPVYYYKTTPINTDTYYSCGGSTSTSACTTVIGTPSVSGYLTTGSNPVYYYTTTTTNTDTYYSCGTNGSTAQSSCTTAVAGTPTVSNYSTTGTNPLYYYIPSSTTKYYDRISRLKDGMFDLLNGNTTRGVTRLGDDKVIGLSYFSYGGDGKTGSIVVPARSLDTVVSGVTQRQILMNNIAGFTAYNGTPTANAYVDAAAYLMGTTTTQTGTFPLYAYYDSSTGWQCKAYNSSNACTDWGNYVYLPSSVPAGSVSNSSCKVTVNNYSATCYFYANPYSGFANSSSGSKSGSNYLQPTSISSQLTNTASQTCSGQGIYVLTDGEPNSSSNNIASGLMTKALSTKGSTFNCNSSLLSQVNDSNGNDNGGAWQCIGNFSQALLDGTKNPTGLKIKTAVVGFGNTFSSIPSYDPKATQQQNIDSITNANAAADPTNAAKWGVYSGGGWYRGSSSQDVVDSVNNFINSLNTDIPAVTTGVATIPVDALNTQALQPFAYFPQFQPTPDKTYQLWTGNVKKYNVSGGVLKDTSLTTIVDASGNLVKNTVDLWASSASTDLQKIGGSVSQLQLRDSSFATPPVSPATTQRKLLSNRTVDSTGAASDSTTLSAITKDYITADNTKLDPDRGYLMNLLGYNVDPTTPSAITDTSLAAAPELRQMGGVMHSLPLLLTSKGKISISGSTVTSTNREDYVLFGSTEGLLHVVNASTGVEKFAFLPNEMVAKQKQAFYDSKTTSGGLTNLFYGVDGPWALYAEYVPSGSGGLTVGTGKSTGSSTTSQGKQLVFGGLRMGGKSYYSLDLKDMDNPVLKFRVNPEGAASGTALSYMGQSWSKPTLAYVKWRGARKLVMFVGGGYDTGYESDSYEQTNKTGAGVYMFDASNGDLLWWASANASADVNTGATGQAKAVADMKYSVVSRISAVDRNSDGLVDHLFFGDLGGQVWRIDLNNSLLTSNTTATTPSPFATHAVRLLNAHSATSGASPRFYDAASFTVYKSNPTFGVVTIGSGNRSQPLKSYAVGTAGRNQDAIYTIYDKDVAAVSLYNTADADLTTKNLTLGTTTDSLTALTKTDRNTKVEYTAAGGWYYPFSSTSAGAKVQDAKVMGEPVAIDSNLYVSVYDSAAPGLSGDCGAGVKGATTINRFCLPYSKCTDGSSTADNTLFMGAGILGVTLGAGDEGPTSRQVIGGDCTNSACATNGDGTGAGKGFKVKAPLTTSAKLIPIRWYEKSPKSATGN